jgi:dolichyl-phosphate-mannose-protein mannosyltransferase
MTRPGPAGPVPPPEPRRFPASLVALLVAAALLRIAGLASPGHGGDINAFVQWAEGAARSGLGGYYANGGDSNYPPMLYLLWPLGVALDGADLSFAIRLISVPFDLALGWLLYDLVGRATGRERDGLLGAALYLLNPAVLIVGPIWGQVDGMGALPMVASIVAVARGRPFLAGALAVVAGLVKPQFGIAAFTLLGLGLFWLRTGGDRRRFVLLALGALVAFVVVLAPLGLGPFGYLRIMSDTFSRYPYISQFGFNPWGMLFGFGTRDDAWVRLGTGLAIAGITSSLWLLRRRRDLVGILGVSVLVGLAIYFLPTRVHERYLFGAVALLGPLAVLEPRLRGPFTALSLAFFGTLVYVLVTSPYRILPTPKLAELPGWAISAMCLVMTLAGAWAALRVVELFRQPGLATAGAPVGGETDSAASG